MVTSLLLLLPLQASAPTVVARPDPAFHSPATLELTRVGALHRTPDGHILLFDQAGESVYLLDSAGSPLPPLARKGSGPGEVRSPITVGSIGDTIWITDGALRRISYFSPNLKFLRSEAEQERCGDLPWAIAPDGRCVTLPQPHASSSASVPDSLPLLLTRPKARTDTLGWVVMARMVIRYHDGESHVRQNFADDPIPVISPNGRYFSWVGQRRAEPNGEPRIRVETRDLATQQKRRFSIGYSPKPLTRDSIAAVLAHYQVDPGNALARWLADSIARRLYRPKFLPAFAGALLDNSGNLWLREQVSPGQAVVIWEVFNLEGIPQLKVQLPAGFHLSDVSGLRLLGTTTDEDDIPSLAQFRMPQAP